ncbi:MAG: cytochrome-c peroxidase [Gammaproteobacteria bacterium]|nr:cytochrome-c peroxidase [Gammaproteobacteria bacterium]
MFLVVSHLLMLLPGALFASELIGEPISPIPIDAKLDLQKVALGEKLFNDPRLSKDNTISCASCHKLELGGTDRKQKSAGVNGVLSATNTPTVFNSRFNVAQFWDGRANTLEEQVHGPVTNPDEMASSWAEIIPKLQKDSVLGAAFIKAYPGGFTGQNIADAIVQYEKSLITPNSPFDRYLRGDKAAISSQQKEGYALFKSYGCIACHQGVNVGGNMFQTMGMRANFFSARKIKKADYGLYNVTGDDFDKHAFKVPSLRLVTETPPYFHDGSVARLDEAIRIMGKYQLGSDVSERDVKLIISFLESLVGKYQPLEQ